MWVTLIIEKINNLITQKTHYGAVLPPSQMVFYNHNGYYHKFNHHHKDYIIIIIKISIIIIMMSYEPAAVFSATTSPLKSTSKPLLNHHLPMHYGEVAKHLRNI